jgi:hypothetical protein
MTSAYLDQTGDIYTPNAVPGIRQLCDLALDGLVPMFDSERQLFCYRLKQTDRGLVPEGHSHRYTMLTLLGLHRSREVGLESPIDIERVISHLVQSTVWLKNLGDIGLLIWLCALARPERLQEICHKVEAKNRLAKSGEAREGRTMELAWFLSGLAHASLALPEEFSELKGVAFEAYRLLGENQGQHGIFGHLSRRKSLAGIFRGDIGSFADQVYPIYALTKFGAAYQFQPALEMAGNCARAICEAQGPQGQWWWHYDSWTGKVFEKYPVYSVHQDGMAPMALLELGETAGLDFTEPVLKGLRWIAGNNELGRDLRDTPAGVIWRSLYHKRKFNSYLNKALRFSHSGGKSESMGDLEIKWECRPYHFGWLLYAFAGRRSLVSPDEEARGRRTISSAIGRNRIHFPKG